MEEYQYKNEMTTRDYVKVLFRHKVVMILTMLTMMATAIFGTLMITPIYESQVKMLITGRKQAQAEYYTDIGLNGTRSAMITLTQSEIVLSDPVLERVVSVSGLAKRPLDYEKTFSSRLKVPFIEHQAKQFEQKMEKLTDEQKKAYYFRLATEDLRKKLEVEPVRDTDLFIIKVKDYNPMAAAVLANIVSRSYVMFDIEQQLAEIELKFGEKNSTVIQLREAIDKMSKGLNGAPLPPIEAIGPATVKIIEQAKVPLKPATIPRIIMVILASIMSVFLGIIAAFVMEYTDQTFKSSHEAKNLLKVRFLGSLPKKAKIEHYEELSKNVYLEMVSKNIKSILITSAEHNKGVTQVAAYLGDYISEHLNKKVLLIEGDLINPTLHRMFELPEEYADNHRNGGKLKLDHGIKHISDNLHIFTLLSEGNGSIGSLTSHMLQDLIDQANEKYDLVIIDAAAIGEYKDTAIISTFADSVVVVINEGKTRQYVVKSVIDELRARKTDVLGVVLSNRKHVLPKFIYNRV